MSIIDPSLDDRRGAWPDATPSGATNNREADLAKGQKRSNRELKKPKADKNKKREAAPVSLFAAPASKKRR